jgi:hypothetical protein
MPTTGLRNNWNEDGEVAPATYTVTNELADRAFDADTVAVAELADVVGTLINDLALQGIVVAA